MLYMEESTDDYVRHGDDEEQELKYQELLVKEGLAEEEPKRISVPLVCSCGSLRCGAIGRFGLPKPTYHEHIEPVWPQMSRDRKAEKMKTAGE